jgi:hypothetical protein
MNPLNKPSKKEKALSFEAVPLLMAVCQNHNGVQLYTEVRYVRICG